MNNFFQSKKWVAILAIIFILCAALVVFEAGVAVGLHKADVANRMGGAYYKAFGPTNQPFGLGDIDQDDYPSSHGVVGTIIKIDPPYAFIQGPNNTERTIRLGSSTTILRYRNEIGQNGLSNGDSIVVIGSPEASSSDIDAEFIRVIPGATGGGTSTNNQ